MDINNKQYEQLKKATKDVFNGRDIEPYINKEMELIKYSLCYGVDSTDIDFNRVNRRLKEYATDTRYSIKGLQSFYSPFNGGLIGGLIQYKGIIYNYLYSVSDNNILIKFHKVEK